jgi:hypothetical protein
MSPPKNRVNLLIFAVRINSADGTQTGSKSQGQDRAFDKYLIIPKKIPGDVLLRRGATEFFLPNPNYLKSNSV